MTKPKEIPKIWKVLPINTTSRLYNGYWNAKEIYRLSLETDRDLANEDDFNKILELKIMYQSMTLK